MKTELTETTTDLKREPEAELKLWVWEEYMNRWPTDQLMDHPMDQVRRWHSCIPFPEEAPADNTGRTQAEASNSPPWWPSYIHLPG